MRPYITVIVDSFREALASWVLWILLAALTITLLLLAPLGLHEQRALELRGSSIRDMEGLAKQIKAESQAASPTPGKQIWSLSDSEFKQAVEQFQEDESPRAWRRLFPQMVDGLNKLIAQRDFYDEASWRNVALPQQAKDLLEQGIDKLSQDDVRWLNRILLRAAYRDQIARLREVEVNFSYLFFSFDPLPMSREMLAPEIENLLIIVMNYIVGLFAVLLAIVVTAAMIPRTFEAGSVDLLLSKPISRSMLFLAKFFGGCAFILLNAMYFIVGLWLIIGARLGIWNHNLLLCIPMLLFSFMIYYSVSALAGVLWKNAIVAVLAAIVFRLSVAAVGFVKVDVIETYFLDPYRIVGMATTEDGLVAANASGQFAEWQAHESRWANIISTQEPPPPAFLQPVIIGPVYDEKSRQLIFLEKPPFQGPQFRALGIRPKLFTASWQDGWKRKNGPTPPSGASWVFLENDGGMLVVASDGVYRIDAAARAPEGTNVLGFNVNLNLKSPYERIGPGETSVHLDSPFTAARDAKSGDIVVCTETSLKYWKRHADGQYTAGPDRGFKDLEDPAMVGIAGQNIVMAFADGRVLALEAKTLKTIAEYHPVSSGPYAVVGIADRWVAVLFHNGKLWIYDSQAKAASVLDNDVSAVTVDGDDHLLVADQHTRVLSYDPASQQVVRRFEPPLTSFLAFYRYVLVPVYTVFPKPGELGDVVEYLLTGDETPPQTLFGFITMPTEDLRQQRRTIDIYTPIWSSALFIIAVLGLTCVYLHRADM